MLLGFDSCYGRISDWSTQDKKSEDQDARQLRTAQIVWGGTSTLALSKKVCMYGYENLSSTRSREVRASGHIQDHT